MNSYKSDNSGFKMYPILQSKLKHLSCVSCKHAFFFQGSHQLRGKIPFLLECGHPICEICVKRSTSRNCAICKSNEENSSNDCGNVSVNLYLMGLINASQSVLVNSIESDIKFQLPESSRTKKNSYQDLEYCSECGLKADFYCQKCAVFFCKTCFSKIHGRALQSHQKISLSENSIDNCRLLLSRCEVHQNEINSDYCNDCLVSVCNHCLQSSHRKHRTISQLEKNKELKPRLECTIENLAEILQRLKRAEKGLSKSIFSHDTSQNEDTKREEIEADLIKHFVYLHGVLQNMEKRFMNQLQQRQHFIGNNFELIKEQIKEQKRTVESAIKVATTALQESNSTADVTAIMANLEKLLDIPCHLFRNTFNESTMRLFVDDSIAVILEDHCRIELPPLPSYSLLKSTELPDDYEVEPISRDDIARLITPVTKALPPRLPVSSSVSNSSLSKPEKNQNDVSENVRITHISAPDCFYTQALARSGELAQLTKTLAKQALTAGRPTEVELNKMYLVQYCKDRKWYRGRVKTSYTHPKTGEQLADIFYVDFGNTESAVSLERIRNMSVQISLVPALARLCTLHDIVPEDGCWSVDANKVMYEMIDGNSKLVQHNFRCENDVYHVDIMKNSPGDGDRPISIRDALIFLEYGSFVTNERLNRINPESIRKYFKEELMVENSYGVRVTNIESPDCIYVQKIGDDCMTKMMIDMTDEYNEIVKGKKGIIYTPQVGIPCAARYNDGAWYRGKITNLLGNRRVEVYFVDFGDKQDYEYNEIRRLHQKYMSIIALAIKVSLKDVAPLKNKWSDEAKNFLTLTLAGQFVKMFVFSKDNDDCYKVTLYIPQEDREINVNAVLVEEKLALSTGSSSQFTDAPRITKKRSKKRKTKTHKSIKLTCENENEDSTDENPADEEGADRFRMPVNILQVESPDSIYVADVQNNKLIRKMIGNLQKFYNKHTSADTVEWKINNVCVAYSAKDKFYHRAKIVDIVSPEEVVVFLYDIAVRETVTIRDLQSLHPKFSTVPTRAFKIKLAGILPCGGTNTWLSLSCEYLRDIIGQNQNSKFWISKAGGIENDAIAVELWVRETRTDGPLAPTNVEINSINRKLIAEGLALPLRGYTEERDKVLAVDLRQQLQVEGKNEENGTGTDIEWLVKDEPQASPLNGTSDSSAILSLNCSNEKDESDGEKLFPIPPRLAAWIPAVPIKDIRFQAVVTNVDRNCVVYLHSVEQNGGTLALINSTLEAQFSGSVAQACDMAWAPNDLCIAQYHNDKKWYRAKVLELLDDDEIKVLFVDYGNEDECKLGTLRKRVIMGHIPIQATKCVIDGLIPDTPSGKWTTSDLDTIHALLVDKESDVTVLDKKADHLVISIAPKQLNYVNLITYMRHQLNFKIRDVDDDMFCAEEFSVADIEMENFDDADVIIEGSITDYVPSSVEHRLEAKEPRLFDLVSDSGPKPINENMEIEYSDEISVISDAESLMERESEKLAKNIEDNLNLTGITSLDEDEIEDEKSESRETIDLCSSNLPSENDYDDYNYDGINYNEFSIPDSVEIINIEPIHPLNPTTFFARLDVSSNIPTLDTYYEDLKKLSKIIEKEAGRQPKLDNISLYSPCAAQFKVDKVWYRAIIIGLNPDDKEAKVRYVDYGNTEYQPIDKLRCMKKEWLDVPIMTTLFRLWGVQVKDEITEKLRKKLQNTLYNGVCTAKIKDRAANLITVILYTDKTCTKTLYDSLVENGMFEITNDE